MVRRILRALGREIRGLHEAAYVLAGFSLLSQVLALLRDRAFAHTFGAGPELDVYFAAFRIPDTAFALLTLFVSSFALIPLLEERTESDKRGLIRSVIALFGVIAVPLTVVLYFFLPSLVTFVAPGFTPDMLEETEMLARVLMVQPLILGVSAIISAYVQSHRRFVLFALAPIFYNVGIITGVLVFYPVVGSVGLAWGVVCGAVLHLLIQLIPIGSIRGGAGVPVRTILSRVVLPSIPRSLALMGNQFLLVVFAAVASTVTVGAVSSLTFAFNLQSVPLTVIGLSYASALFPALAYLARAQRWDEYMKEMWSTVRHIAFWLLPATALSIVLRAHIVRVVLGSGAFSWDDTRLTAALLGLFCISVTAQALMLAFSRAYYAVGKMRTPILLNVGAAVIAACASYALVTRMGRLSEGMYFIETLLRVSDVPGTAVLLIPIAFTISLLGAALIFAILFARTYGLEPGTGRSLWVSFSSSLIGGTCAYLALQAFGPLLPTNTFLGIFTQGLVAGCVGLVGWIAALWLLKSNEFFEARAILRNKFFTYGSKQNS